MNLRPATAYSCCPFPLFGEDQGDALPLQDLKVYRGGFGFALDRTMCSFEAACRKALLRLRNGCLLTTFALQSLAAWARRESLGLEAASVRGVHIPSLMALCQEIAPQLKLC